MFALKRREKEKKLSNKFHRQFNWKTRGILTKIKIKREKLFFEWQWDDEKKNWRAVIKVISQRCREILSRCSTCVTNEQTHAVDCQSSLPVVNYQRLFDNPTEREREREREREADVVVDVTRCQTQRIYLIEKEGFYNNLSIVICVIFIVRSAQRLVS